MTSLYSIHTLNILIYPFIDPFPLEELLTFINFYLLQSENHFLSITSLSPCRIIYPIPKYMNEDNNGSNGTNQSQSSNTDNDGSNGMNGENNQSNENDQMEIITNASKSNSIVKTRKRKREQDDKNLNTNSIFASPEEMDFKTLLGQRDEFSKVKEALLNFLKENKVNRIELSASLSRILCKISKLRKLAPMTTTLSNRILVITDQLDVEQQYVPVMNAVFAAQRMQVLIDCLMLGKNNSPYLQVACNQTGGIYLKPIYSNGLIQYLLQYFIMDAEIRKFVPIALNQETQHFPAVCFETKKNITEAYVCSVCLSIFSDKKSKCPTCGESFRRKLNN